jgi:hypothetical protein
MLKALGLGLLVSGLFSCQHSTIETRSYFDSLSLAQIKLLCASKARVTKVASMGGKEDQSTFVPDTSAWENEMSVFRQLDVFQKPTYRDAYEIQDKMPDAKSNLLIRSYQATRNIPVMQLRFYYHEHFKNLKRIEAEYHERNSLYSTHRRLSMDFDEANGKPLLTRYSIEGVQKMILSDSVRFSIKSVVSY